MTWEHQEEYSRGHVQATAAPVRARRYFAPTTRARQSTMVQTNNNDKPHLDGCGRGGMRAVSSTPLLALTHVPAPRMRALRRLRPLNDMNNSIPVGREPHPLLSLTPAIARRVVLTRRLSGVHAGGHRGLEAGGAEWT